MGMFTPAARIQKIVWEFNVYLKGGNPGGHSVIQRLEFWKAAIGIIRENPALGVGTGDVKNAFAVQYDKMNSPLAKEFRLRSHNQFLAITVALGLTGLIVFLVSLFFPLLAERKYRDYLYLMFFIIAFLSMLSEDTLENQSGVMFYAFFNSLLLFLYKEKKSVE
jgi:O-antigen ligase